MSPSDAVATPAGATPSTASTNLDPRQSVGRLLRSLHDDRLADIRPLLASEVEVFETCPECTDDRERSRTLDPDSWLAEVSTGPRSLGGPWFEPSSPVSIETMECSSVCCGVRRSIDTESFEGILAVCVDGSGRIDTVDVVVREHGQSDR